VKFKIDLLWLQDEPVKKATVGGVAGAGILDIDRPTKPEVQETLMLSPGNRVTSATGFTGMLVSVQITVTFFGMRGEEVAAAEVAVLSRGRAEKRMGSVIRPALH
jgi:hypothetical protein